MIQAEVLILWNCKSSDWYLQVKSWVESQRGENFSVKENTGENLLSYCDLLRERFSVFSLWLFSCQSACLHVRGPFLIYLHFSDAGGAVWRVLFIYTKVATDAASPSNPPHSTLVEAVS